MVIHGLGLLKSLAETPVWIVRGHAVIGHVAQHAVLVADLELLWVAVQPDLRHPLADLVVPVLQIAHRPVGHEPPNVPASCRAASCVRLHAKRWRRGGAASTPKR